LACVRSDPRPGAHPDCNAGARLADCAQSIGDIVGGETLATLCSTDVDMDFTGSGRDRRSGFIGLLL
jgi:hypothetical protein